MDDDETLSDGENEADAETAIAVSAYGHFGNLAARLRSNAKLTDAERWRIAEILEGKNKMKGRPSSLGKAAAETDMAMHVILRTRRGEKVEAAVATAAKEFGVSRARVFAAVRSTRKKHGIRWGQSKKL